MKKLLLVLCMFLLSTVLSAHTWEILITVKNSQGQLVSNYTVGIYTLNTSTGSFDLVQSILSEDHAHYLSANNIVCDIQLPDGTIYSESTDPTATVPWMRYMIIKIGGKYIRYDESADTPLNNRCGDVYLEYNTDSGVLTEVSNASYWSTIGIYNWSDSYAFTLQNSFSSGTVRLRSTDYATGTTLTRLDGSFPHTITATYDGVTVDNYERKFRSWTLPATTSSTVAHSLSTGNMSGRTSGNVKAEYAKKCNINFKYQYQDKTDNSGTMYVNSTTYSAPTSAFGMYDYVSQTVTAINPTLYGVVYTFNSWKKVLSSDTTQVSTSTTYTFTPSTHAEYLAYVTPAKPAVKSFSYSGTTGDYITLTWSDSGDDSRITGYNVYRRIRRDGVTGDPVLLTTVARSVNTYTDYECTYTETYSEDLIWYDVRAQMTLNSTTVNADENYVAVYGYYDNSNRISSGNKITAQTSSAVQTEYKLSNYPNPFNPTTVIQYTMPEAGQVVLKIYNMIGQEVRTLVDGMQSAGVHTVNFNASGLPTGIYVARIQAVAKVMSLKLQLVK